MADIIKSENKLATVDSIKKEYIEDVQENKGMQEEYKRSIIKFVESLEIGDVYFRGSSDRTIVIVDSIVVKDETHNDHKYRNFIVYYREWDYTISAWSPKENRSSLYDFQQYVNKIGKFTKHPLEIIKESEEALLTGDISKYMVESQETDDQDGPGTDLLHVGSKENLQAIKLDLEQKKNHALVVRSMMGVIIENKKRDLEKIREKMAAQIVIFEKKIRKIFRVITTIELYLGISETITQIQEGPTASVDEPICIRQSILYMDEEVGDPWDDGQGIEWTHMDAFDKWLTRNGNYKKVVPELKGMVAFKARRKSKDKGEMNPYMKMQMDKMDEYTFLLIRNGDNLYRLITDKIEFTPRLFPKRNELQQLFELWKLADAQQEKHGGQDWYLELNEEDKKKFPDLHISSHTKISDIKEKSEDGVFFYKMRFALFQGILERTEIFNPVPEPIKLFSHEAQEKGQVKLIYDEEMCLPSHKKEFWEWIKELNSKITYGSRIILSHNWSYKSNFGHMYSSEGAGNGFRQSRLDDRYGDGKGWSNLPEDPEEGLYYVKKGYRIVIEPVWIENPEYNPNLYTTRDEDRYCPEYKLNEESYHLDNVSLTTEEAKSIEDQLIENRNPFGDRIYAKVKKNPKMLHKYVMEKYHGWRKDQHGEHLEPKFQFHNVKREFMCIRYNPKDIVGENNMMRSWKDPKPEERKMNLSWKIYNDDAFIINYDDIKIEDIDFYLNSRIDRRHYIHIMPLLWKVRETLIEEQKSEVDFKKLIAGEVLRSTGTLPTDEQIDDAVEDWKKNLIWKRAIQHDDEKALRMIVKKLSK